jgi:uncharacterized membrane protein
MDRERLDIELRELEREGVLTASQRGQVAARLVPLLPKKVDGVSRFVSIVAMLGAALLASGILMFFAANWASFPQGFKLFLIFATLLGFHHFGYRLAEDPGRSPRIGRALTATGVLLFGAAIGLIAQIYHLTSHHHHAFLVWWLTSIPFVLLTRSRAILAIVVTIFLGWLALESGVWLDDHLERLRFEGWLAAYAVLGLAVAALFRGLIALSRRGGASHFEDVFRRMSPPIAIAGVYAITFRDVLESDSGAIPWLVFGPALIVGGVAAALLGFELLRRRDDRRAARTDALDGLLLLGTASLFVVLIRFAPAATAIVANVVLLGGLLALIARGVQLRAPAYVNWGVLAFLVVVITRYFEYLHAFLDPFWSFLGAGALMLYFGRFIERRRKDLISRAALAGDRDDFPSTDAMEAPR